MSDYYAAAEAVLPLWAAARKTDPPSSHAAAAKAKKFRGGHAQRILEALAAGPAGQSEIARRCGLLPHQVNKRLHELVAGGEILPTGRDVLNGNGFKECEYRRCSL